MAITATTRNKLNKMNRAAQDANLGSLIENFGFAGSHVVVLSEMSASAVTVYNALATGGMYLFDVTRSGSVLAKEGNYFATRSGGSLTINPYNSGSFTVGDVVHFVIY